MEIATRIVVCDEPALRNRLQTQLVEAKILPLARFLPNGLPAVIVASAANYAAANHLLDRISLTVRNQSVVTGRIPRGQSVPVLQPNNIVLLPWCEDEIFAQWAKLLLGLQTQFIFPDWLLKCNFTPPPMKIFTSMNNLLKFGNSSPPGISRNY